MNKITRLTDLEIMQTDLKRIQATNNFSLKVSKKGAVSIYGFGLGRFPITLHKEQWLRILSGALSIYWFIRENDSRLKDKD